MALFERLAEATMPTNCTDTAITVEDVTYATPFSASKIRDLLLAERAKVLRTRAGGTLGIVAFSVLGWNILSGAEDLATNLVGAMSYFVALICVVIALGARHAAKYKELNGCMIARSSLLYSCDFSPAHRDVLFDYKNADEAVIEQVIDVLEMDIVNLYVEEYIHDQVTEKLEQRTDELGYTD